MPESERETGQSAGQFHGLVHLLEEVGRGAEAVFSRVFGALDQGDKIRVDAKALQNYRETAESIRERARRQTIEIARLTGILGHIDEGVIMQDPDGRIILMNEAARPLVGSRKTFWQSELGQMFKQARGLPPVEHQMQMVGKPQRVDVGERVVGVKIAAINNTHGEHLGTVMILKDMTQDSIGERLRSSFITHMSHELRTPLTSIKGASDVLLNLPEGKPPKRSFLEAISRNVAILDRMVVELLDISEINDGHLMIDRAPLSLEDITFTILKGFEPRIVQAELSSTSMVANQRALNILGDHRRLQWALGHIVDNAINYTLPGGEIVVQLGKVRENRVLLEVIDSGVGIQAKDLPRIFEPFYRGEARSTEGRVIDPRGLGQGLYIAQTVIMAHGGQISVASVPGQGSTFTIALPTAS